MDRSRITVLPGSSEVWSRVQDRSPRAKKVATGIKIASVAALLVGGGAWVATDRAVTLRVDGEQQTVHTHADDVRGVLAAADVKVGDRDEVVPALDSEVRRGDTIEIDRARKLKVTVDGATREVWVTAPTVDEALDELSMGRRDIKLSASRHSRLPLDGAVLSVRTPKQVTLTADGRTTTATTYASTVDELLDERGLALDGDDKSTPAVASVLASGQKIVVQRIATKSVTQTVTVPSPVTSRSDSSMTSGTKRVVTRGRSGSARQVVRYVYTDGKVTSKEVISKTVVTAPTTTVVMKGTKKKVTKSYPTSGNGLNWAALAKCESGGNPSAVSPGGTYHGLYQFSVGTWTRMGGSGLPSQASASEQTMRAQMLYSASGAGQWPVCGSRLFS
ncbi:ubiquitin-like domain-containing protein [Cryptosporangium sp. NPDC051539]|uniref:ubiquitin-like domain-containing protein n=1 Tax=Cryptosporangium sp. NPDC051539 TaxID=3363962 RepID=UPI00379EF551